jgi:hypothetical protein
MGGVGKIGDKCVDVFLAVFGFLINAIESGVVDVIHIQSNVKL